MLSSAVFLLPRWSETPVAAVMSSLKCRKYKVRFDVNINIESFITFTAIIEGSIERHKSRLALRKAGDGLTGTLGEA